jgi:hypothetical protein
LSDVWGLGVLFTMLLIALTDLLELGSGSIPDKSSTIGCEFIDATLDLGDSFVEEVDDVS